MVNSDYSIYQKPKSWISRLSIRARGIVTKSQHNDDQVSILSAPEILPSPASSVTSMSATDDDDDDDDDENSSTFVSPSPSSSTYSIISVKKPEQTTTSQRRQSKNQEQQQTDTQKHLFPPSPILTAYDKLPSISQPACHQRRIPRPFSTANHSPVLLLPPLKDNSYFSSDRPLPTKRRTPGRNRHSSSINTHNTSRDSAYLIKHENEHNVRHSVALEQLAHDTLTYFVDTSSSESPSITNPELCDHKNDDHAAKLVEKLKSRLTLSASTTSVHPSVLKLAQDVMNYMNETLPLTNECQQLKPKLEVCLMIHGNKKAVN